MHAVVDAYRQGLAATRQNPRYLLSTVVLAAVGGGASVLLERLPYGLGTVLNTLLVTPLLVAVLVGLALAALTGKGSRNAGVETARRHYVTLVGVFAVLVVLAVVLVVLAATGSALLALAMGWRPPPPSALAMGAGAVTAAGTTLWLAMGLVSLPTFLLAFALVQFVDVAVVVDDRGVLGAYRASLRLCWRRPVGVAAYTLARLGVFGLALVATWFAWTVAARVLGPDATGGVTVAVGLVAASLAYAVINASHVAYYRDATAVP